MRIVVVGAGILGSSAAYHLSQRDNVEVTVIDEAHQGKATLAGAGIVCPWATKVTDPDFYRFYAAGGAYYRPLVEGLAARGETEFGYRQVGALVLAETEEQLAEIEARVLPRVADVPEAGAVRRVSAAETKQMFPPLRDGLMALHIPGGARVEARAIAGAMRRAAEANGAIFRQGHADIESRDGKASVSLDGKAIAADMVIVTAGAWANQALTAIGATIPVEPQRGQIVHLGVKEETIDWPVLLPQVSHYMLAFDDNRVVAGATRENGVGFDYRLTAGGQAEVLNFALDLAPGLSDATHIETRIGLRPMAENYKPLIGALPGFDNVLIGNGLGAGGLTMGPLAGKLLTQLAMGQATDIDLAPYAVGA
ncbi:FAD-dependent oxidoreductase [Devosia sp. FJ2-5-3]|uniref:NAD(P)/FAD-dependent oxidoreductase n=1 Tax=Devosia sp. FJ2-5-3 TaxID=2976680 RepID=UPI0023D87334|nr:FAD-dependent oxidoreductase [Devosia sp. FJ2-5-3]WEJ56953.1 FAD-binding oxidoreductase [Devosia sp. FJ2-5-3]